jgi:UDP-GlcNAc:undecaprenyl-phosphate GlcNAc-1-phosphate transferase
MYVIILSFLTAFTLTYFVLPSIISISKAKRLFDEPNNRSSHTVSTPSLGGIGIFAGAIFSIVLWTPFGDFGNLQYILCAFIIIFLIGAKDDISPISPTKKLIGQILAAAILIFKSDIRLSGFYGLFGVHDPLWEPFCVLLTIFTMLVIINAFNLIDGINGLAGSIGALITGTLGCWFFMVDRIEFAIVAFATTGAVIAFLKYNYTPAKIFMGDTGSLLIGLVSAILAIEFIDLNYHLEPGHPFKLEAVPAVAMGILILPLFDTLRVFTTRIIRRQSPFQPDRRHIHHLLIDSGFTHMEATASLVFTNILFIVFVLSFNRQLELHALLAFIVAFATVMTYYLHKSVVRKKLERAPMRDG